MTNDGTALTVINRVKRMQSSNNLQTDISRTARKLLYNM
uniref:Uncharacterized protein n=1 Tax=Anguilla anguilla TaxID=7936 RepID=A0A0E9PFN7_ANGAN